MIVKVCGITRLEDAVAAARLGARAIGFIFWEGSPRYIDPHRARKIAAALPPFVTPVGVFVNQDLAYVNGVANLVRLGAVQLHGDEDPAYASAVTRPVIKAVAAGASFDAASVDRWRGETLVLLDVHDPVARGGTGHTIDWNRAAAVARRRRVLLAGGLSPENVADAVAIVRPFGIDISSGVEAAPGIKDHHRLDALFDTLTRHVHNHESTRS